jgi:hypothetical protein
VKKVDASLTSGACSVKFSYLNPSLTDAREFIKSIGSLIPNRVKTVRRFRLQSGTIDVTPVDSTKESKSIKDQ